MDVSWKVEKPWSFPTPPTLPEKIRPRRRLLTFELPVHCASRHSLVACPPTASIGGSWSSRRSRRKAIGGIRILGIFPGRREMAGSPEHEVVELTAHRATTTKRV